MKKELLKSRNQKKLALKVNHIPQYQPDQLNKKIYNAKKNICKQKKKRVYIQKQTLLIEEEILLIEQESLQIEEQVQQKIYINSTFETMYRSMLEAANEIYAEYISSGEDIMKVAQKPTLFKLKNVIENVKKEHFGISSNQYANAVLFNDKNTISYANIHSEDDERFSFGLFFIPKGGFLPLHDHPNMFVFSKILMGKVKRLSFSLTNRNIQFEYPHALILQKMYLQQQQLLIQQKQMMTQRSQQIQQQLQLQQSQQVSNKSSNNNNNQNQNNISDNDVVNDSNTNDNINKKYSSEEDKQNIVESNGKRQQQLLNDAGINNQSQKNKQQNQLIQQFYNNQNQGGQKVQNNSANKGENGNINNVHIDINKNGVDPKLVNGQMQYSQNFNKQAEKGQEFILKKNGTNYENNDSNQNVQYQSNQNSQLSKQQQINQQQNAQQQIKMDKKIPDLMNLIQPQLVEASLDSEEILCEGFIDDLDPFHKNLHYIEAVEDCIFFDVLLPHYDLKKRHCNYYNILNFPDHITKKAILAISNQPINQCKVQYFTIEKSTCEYFS